MDKMWLSFYAMGAMFASLGVIYVSRQRLHNRFLKALTAIVAYGLLLFGFFGMVYVVFNGPTGGPSR